MKPQSPQQNAVDQVGYPADVENYIDDGKFDLDRFHDVSFSARKLARSAGNHFFHVQDRVAVEQRIRYHYHYYGKIRGDVVR